MKSEILKAAGSDSTPLFEHIEAGIYRYTLNGNYYERPTLNGKRTWRSLKTKNLKSARKKLRWCRSGVARAPRVQPEVFPRVDSELAIVGDVIHRYQEDGYLDKDLNQRPEGTRRDEERHCTILIKFWKNLEISAATEAACDSYHDWRISRVQQGTGNRAIDRELNTLNNACRYAKRRGLIGVNPLADRPRYQSSKSVRHCREFMPGSADELHACAGILMKHPHSVVLGFQQLFEAMTGLRTCEVLKWRTDAGPDDPGYVTPDGKSLRVWRCKGQHAVNPFVKVHAGLAALLIAHRKWKEECRQESPWYFPSPRGTEGNVGKRALAHALWRLHLKNGIKKFTSHGSRAFYVTVRRSHGIPDSQIAFEIGHTSGGATLATVYGGVPPHWLTGEGPQMSWLPTGKPAWESIKPTKVPRNQARNADASK
jgi:integrase